MNSSHVPILLAASDLEAVVGVIFFALLFGLFVWSLVWVFRDAEARGKSGCLVAGLVFLVGWPLSLFAWLAFRPERTEPPYRMPPPPFCPRCGAAVSPRIRRCAVCGMLT